MQLFSEPHSYTTTGTHVVCSDKCIVTGLLIATDGTNNPTVAVHDGSTGSDPTVIPSTAYDASSLGLHGAMYHYAVYCKKGCALVISGSGSREVTIFILTLP